MHMHSDDTYMPCESLLVKDGIATCLIHEVKPDVCKDYPESNRGVCRFKGRLTEECVGKQEHGAGLEIPELVDKSTAIRKGARK